MENFEDFSEVEPSKEKKALLPKSRKAPLGSGKLPPEFGLTDFLYLMYDCHLTKEMKRTLIYYASRFNWTERLPTYVSLSRAANDLHVGRKYLSNDLKELEKWGWVSVAWKNSTQTYAVSVQIGNEIEGLNWMETESKKKQIAEQNLERRRP